MVLVSKRFTSWTSVVVGVAVLILLALALAGGRAGRRADGTPASAKSYDLPAARVVIAVQPDGSLLITEDITFAGPAPARRPARPGTRERSAPPGKATESTSSGTTPQAPRPVPSGSATGCAAPRSPTTTSSRSTSRCGVRSGRPGSAGSRPFWSCPAQPTAPACTPGSSRPGRRHRRAGVGPHHAQRPQPPQPPAGRAARHLHPRAADLQSLPG